MLGVLYGCMGLIFLPFFALFALIGTLAQAAGHSDTSGQPPMVLAGAMMFGFGIMMPVMYGVFGFIFGVISAAVYNLIARWIGGFEVEVE